MLTLHVVSHTHWDREWYHPAERFRQRLVELIDELLDDAGASGSFLLDGQTVVLEDYLEVRPERASDLSAALRDGKLEAGPWYVLADALIPGGEGLVRNLLAGRRALRALRADSPPVLYCPDSFGHPAALPELAAGFGKPLVLLWRGFAGNRDIYWWTAPSRARVLLYHLTASGYELGANLPTDTESARARWKRIRAEIGGRPITGAALLLNGADHHAAQRDRVRAIDTLASVAAPEVVRGSSLAEFSADLQQRVRDASLTEVSGELRDSYGYTWTLQGTLASRTPQKRQYALIERMLLRDVEPWVALAAFSTGRSRRPLMHAAWKPLLLCQPHDTLCGCSVDAVARAMEQRLESAAVQGGGLREDAMLDLILHDRDGARSTPERWVSSLIVRNPAPRARSGVALVEWTIKLGDVPVGPGSGAARVTLDAAKGLQLNGAQLLGVTEGYERIEAPRAYPDNDAVLRCVAAVWMRDVPAYGIDVVPVDAVEAPEAVPHPVVVEGRSLGNGLVRLQWDARGRITLTDSVEKRTIRGLLEWESRADVGDLYTPAIRGRKLTPRLLKTGVAHRGPLRGVVQQTWRLAGKKEHVDLTVQLVIDADSRVVRIIVLGDNQAFDHRMRLIVRTGVSKSETFADAAFGSVPREPIEVGAKNTAAEKPVPTAPLHRYVSVFDPKRGATLYSDGLTEYETVRGGIAVTLLRCVGELSRNDLRERPGHAGWPAPTPEAQNLGSFEAELGLMLHGPRTDATIDLIERTADDVLHPITGDTLRSADGHEWMNSGVTLEGTGLAFSTMKESEDGSALVLRCTNLLDAPVAGSWQLPMQVGEAWLTRLDETPLTKLTAAGDRIAFQAPPRGVVTILVRF